PRRRGHRGVQRRGGGDGVRRAAALPALTAFSELLPAWRAYTPMASWTYATIRRCGCARRSALARPARHAVRAVALLRAALEAHDRTGLACPGGRGSDLGGTYRRGTASCRGGQGRAGGRDAAAWNRNAREPRLARSLDALPRDRRARARTESHKRWGHHLVHEPPAVRGLVLGARPRRTAASRCRACEVAGPPLS